MPEHFKRLAERVQETGYELISPLDYLILEQLPDEGTIMGGYYELGANIGELQRRHFPDLSSGNLSGRVRPMAAQGLTRKIRMVGTRGKWAWQRTEEGRRVLEEWKEAQRGSDKGS